MEQEIDYAPIVAKLVQGYVKAVGDVFGETVDNSAIIISAAQYLRQCIEFATRDTGNYDSVFNGVVSVMQRSHAEQVQKQVN